MLAKIHSVALRGIEAYGVQVELDLANGLPGFTTVGLPNDAVREAKSRVGSALRNSGFSFPARRITVNLSPARARKEGTHFDLPIALALLSASGQVLGGGWQQEYCFIGELALDGRVLPIPGVLAMALEAKARGFSAIAVPAENGAEARASGLETLAVSSLRETAEFLSGRGPYPQDHALAAPISEEPESFTEDLADVKGQALAKRALEIAAAGGHNILMVGSPGVGKSMLARRLAGLLPPMTAGEALEVTKIHSAAWGRGTPGLVTRRPFRSPHHTATTASLVGGGAQPRPGEVSLAHGGVLFLDELAEFGRESLEALRQPLEDFKVVISRSKEVVEFPARFLLAAATNPCPCGYRGHPDRRCRCTPPAVQKYLGRLSGPLLDRIDIQVELAPLEFKQWAGAPPDAASEGSAAARARVWRARSAQRSRFLSADYAVNAYIPAPELRRHCALDAAGLRLLEIASKKMSLSARSLDRALKVARTVADLGGSEKIGAEHLAEAISLRGLDRLQEAL